MKSRSGQARDATRPELRQKEDSTGRRSRPCKSPRAGLRSRTEPRRCYRNPRWAQPTNSPQDDDARYADSATAPSVRSCSITTGRPCSAVCAWPQGRRSGRPVPTSPAWQIRSTSARSRRLTAVSGLLVIAARPAAGDRGNARMCPPMGDTATDMRVVAAAEPGSLAAGACGCAPGLDASRRSCRQRRRAGGRAKP